MFDIGFSEMIIVGVIALIAIGPKQLPEVARVVGRFLNDMKRMSGEITNTVMQARESTNQLLSDTKEQITQHLDFSGSQDTSKNPHELQLSDSAHEADPAQESFHFSSDEEVTPTPSEPPHPQQLEFDHLDILGDEPTIPVKKDPGLNDT